MTRARIPLAALLMLSGCRYASAPSVVDPGMAAFLPPATKLVAWVDLQRLRGSALYAALPPAAVAVLDPLRDANSTMIASDGKNLLLVARGPFRESPPGATMVGSDLALSGTPDFLAAAIAQHKTGRTGAPGLIDYAAAVAPGTQIWIAADGGAPLQLSGNAANWNRLMRDMDYAAMTVKLGAAVDVALIARGRTPEAAAKFENTLRAAITLAAAAESRRPDLVAALHAIRVTREDRTAHANLAASPEMIRELAGQALSSGQ